MLTAGISLLGLRVVESLHMTRDVEDWSRVRSPSRAKRRLRYGHPQNIRLIKVPRMDAMRFGDQIVMHPEAAKELRRRAALPDPQEKP